MGILAKIWAVMTGVAAYFSWKEKKHDEKVDSKAIELAEEQEEALDNRDGRTARSIFYRLRRMRKQADKRRK